MDRKLSLKRRTFKKSPNKRYKRSKKNTLKRRVSKRNTLRRKSFRGGRPRHGQPSSKYPITYEDTKSWTGMDFESAIQSETNMQERENLEGFFFTRQLTSNNRDLEQSYKMWLKKTRPPQLAEAGAAARLSNNRLSGNLLEDKNIEYYKMYKINEITYIRNVPHSPYIKKAIPLKDKKLYKGDDYILTEIAFYLSTYSEYFEVIIPYIDTVNSFKQDHCGGIRGWKKDTNNCRESRIDGMENLKISNKNLIKMIKEIGRGLILLFPFDR